MQQQPTATSTPRDSTMRRFLLEEVDKRKSPSSTDRILVLADGVVFFGTSTRQESQGQTYAWVAVHWRPGHGSGVSVAHFDAFVAENIDEYETPLRFRHMAWLD